LQERSQQEDLHRKVHQHPQDPVDLPDPVAPEVLLVHVHRQVPPDLLAPVLPDPPCRLSAQPDLSVLEDLVDLRQSLPSQSAHPALWHRETTLRQYLLPESVRSQSR